MRMRRRKVRARVEMLPLMDVVFLLLVFFIYSMMAMAVHRALPLNLPSSNSAELDRSVNLALSVTADGDLYLDKIALGPDALVARLREENGRSGEDGVSLQVFADGELSYQELYKVLDLIKASGVTKITLQAKGESAAP